MMETDPPPLTGRAGEATGKRGFSLGTAFRAVTGRTAPEPQPVLMWLAGAGYKPKEEARRKGMAPVPKSAEDAADRLFDTVPPEDTLRASRMRAEVLVNLHRDARSDPRVRDIFEHDAILVADTRTGWLVTESMLRARFALFDALHTLLDVPALDGEAREGMRDTLIAAFNDLAPDSQREWCYSELRLEQGVALLETRKPGELMDLADTLRPIFHTRGPWDALRLFGIAAAMNDIREGKTVPVVDLLQM